MNEPLEPLDPTLLAALDVERARPAPDPQQLARLASRIEATFSALPAAGVASAAAATATAVGTKVALLVGGLLVGGVGGAVLHAELAPPREVIVERRVEVPVPAPAAVPAPVPVPLPPEVVPPSPSPVPRKPAVAAPVVTAPAAPARSGIERERLLVEQATVALARGRGDEALAACDAHARDFASGQLSEERESLAIRALVLLGRREEAGARAEVFRRRWPDSLMLDVVDAALR